MRIGEGYADLDGQLRLPMPDAGNPTADELFEAAEIAEDAGEWASAERHYRRALDLDGGDQGAAFNLANALAAQDRGAEAQIYLRRALAIDPDFAEAWYNLAGFLDAAADRAGAKDSLNRRPPSTASTPMRCTTSASCISKMAITAARSSAGSTTCDSTRKASGREGAARDGGMPPPRQARPLNP